MAQETSRNSDCESSLALSVKPLADRLVGAAQLDDEVKNLYTHEDLYDVRYNKEFNLNESAHRGHTGFDPNKKETQETYTLTTLHAIFLIYQMFEVKDASHERGNPISSIFMGSHSLAIKTLIKTFGETSLGDHYLGFENKLKNGAALHFEIERSSAQTSIVVVMKDGRKGYLRPDSMLDPVTFNVWFPDQNTLVAHSYKDFTIETQPFALKLGTPIVRGFEQPNLPMPPGQLSSQKVPRSQGGLETGPLRFARNGQAFRRDAVPAPSSLL